MSLFFLTFGIILLCAIALGIGKLITGKSKLSCKRCGKPEDDSCDICHKPLSK